MAGSEVFGGMSKLEAGGLIRLMKTSQWLGGLGVDIEHTSMDDIVAVDKYLNGAFGTGDYAHTISYELGVAEANGNVHAHAICQVLAKILGPDHCKNAVANEGGMPPVSK